MKIERCVRDATAFAALVLSGVAFGQSVASWSARGDAAEDPIRIWDSSEFRALAVSEGTLVQLGDMGRRYPDAMGLEWSPDSRQLLVLGDFESHCLLDARSGTELTRFGGSEGVFPVGREATWTARNTLFLEGLGDEVVHREVPGPQWGMDPALAKLNGLELRAASQDGRWAVMAADTEWNAESDAGPEPDRRVLSLESMEFTWSIPDDSEGPVALGAMALAPDGSLVAWMGWAGLTPCIETCRLDRGAPAGAGAAKRLTFEPATLDALEGVDLSLEESRLAVADGGATVVCSLAGWIVSFDVKSGRQTAARQAGEGWAARVGVARDLVVYTGPGGTLHSASLPTLEPRGVLRGLHELGGMGLAPDGRRAAVLDGRGGLSFVSISEDGSLTLQSERPKDALFPGASSAFFGSASDQVLLGTVDGRVLRLDLSTGQCALVPCRGVELNQKVVGFAEWPVGVRAAFQWDGARYVDKRRRGEPERVDLHGMDAFGFQPATSADGTALLIGKWEGHMVLRQGDAAPRTMGEPDSADAAALSPSGARAAIVAGSELWIYGTPDMDLLYRGAADGKPEQGLVGVVDSIAGFLDETYIVVQYSDGYVRIVDVSGDVVSVLDEAEEYAPLTKSVRPILSRDGRWLLCAGSDRGLRVFDMDSEALAMTVVGEAWAEGVQDWCISADSEHLVVVRSGGEVELWRFPKLLDLAGRLARGQTGGTERTAGASAEASGDIARHSLAAADHLRRKGELDLAVEAYLRAEIAAPLGLDAMESRSVGRRILAGIHRCGAPADAWLAVRQARGEHRVRAAVFLRKADRDLADGAITRAGLMDPRRSPAARGLARAGAPGGVSALRSVLKSLQTPTYPRSLGKVISPAGAVAACLASFEAAKSAGGSAARGRAHLEALDRLSLEKPSPARAALLAQLPPPLAVGARSQEHLGGAWMELAGALDDVGLARAARAARGQGRVWISPQSSVAGVTPDAADADTSQPGAERLNDSVAWAEKDTVRVQRALRWWGAGVWESVARGGVALESVFEFAFASEGTHGVTQVLKPGPRTLLVRARCCGQRRLGAAFGGRALLVLCEMDGPILRVRVTRPGTGELLLSGATLLAGAQWEPFDLVISLNESRSRMILRVGEGPPMLAAISPADVEGAVELVFSGLHSEGELAMRGFRIE